MFSVSLFDRIDSVHPASGRGGEGGGAAGIFFKNFNAMEVDTGTKIGDFS